MRDAYLDEDTGAAARRFEASGEFAAVRVLLGDWIAGATVLDLGAGTGIASRAFAQAGATRVVALEPDLSSVVGQGAIARACEGLPAVLRLSGDGECLPLREGAMDIVYARQVLHQAHDLLGLLRSARG
jgi:ubiquinone/menaquinone biosynthesis C-methylase UbiE